MLISTLLWLSAVLTLLLSNGEIKLLCEIPIHYSFCCYLRSVAILFFNGLNCCFQELQADFEGRNPEDCDFHGIKQLLRQLFLKSDVDLGGLAEIIICELQFYLVLIFFIDL